MRGRFCSANHPSHPPPPPSPILRITVKQLILCFILFICIVRLCVIVLWFFFRSFFLFLCSLLSTACQHSYSGALYFIGLWRPDERRGNRKLPTNETKRKKNFFLPFAQRRRTLILNSGRPAWLKLKRICCQTVYPIRPRLTSTELEVYCVLDYYFLLCVFYFFFWFVVAFIRLLD